MVDKQTYFRKEGASTSKQSSKSKDGQSKRQKTAPPSTEPTPRVSHPPTPQSSARGSEQRPPTPQAASRVAEQRPQATQSAQRASDARPLPPLPPASSSRLGDLQSSRDFRSEHCREQYFLDIPQRKVSMTKIIDFTGWESFEIREMFDRIGLQGLYSLHGDSCEKIVRLFYANIAVTAREGVISSYIMGQEFEVTPKVVNDILGFHEEDAERYYHALKTFPILATDEGTAFCRQIHRNADIEGFVKPIARELNVKARILHNLIAHTILPRVGHREHVSYMCLYVMERLYSGRKFDPGFVILSHMREISRARNKNLAYTVLIMKIIQHFQIQIPRAAQLLPQRQIDAFGRSHLVKMGLREVDGVWTEPDDVRPPPLLQPPRRGGPPIDIAAIRQEIRDTVAASERRIMKYLKGISDYQRETRKILQTWIDAHSFDPVHLGADLGADDADDEAVMPGGDSLFETDAGDGDDEAGARDDEAGDS